MHHVFHKLTTLLTDFISPPACMACRKLLLERAIFCSDCQARIMPVVSIQITLTPSKKLTVFAIGSYHEPLKSLIMTKSWSDPLGSTFLGDLMWQMTPIKHLYFDYLIPIPLHWTRQAWRGFNQAERMAQVIARKSGRPIVEVLKRTKRTVFQSSIDKNKRHLNVHDAFTLTTNSCEFEGKHLVIVDDLMTTGATLHQAARALLPLKPASIIAVVACRVV